VRSLIRQHRIRGVVHLARKKSAEESVRRPLHFYRENVEGLPVLLEAVGESPVTSFVFTSRAGVYGSPGIAVVDEASTATR
jgi:UDP-glucose 4-epimerase